MKRVMNIFSCIAIILMVLGGLFKINHWPNSAVFLVLSQGFLCLFYLPMIYAYKRKDFIGWKGRFTAGFGIFCVALFMLAVLFKTMHWPGAGPMFVLSLALFAFIFIPSYCIQRYRLSENRAQKLMNVFAAVSVSLFVIGILAKIMHWPMATLFLALGTLLFLFVFLPAFISSYKKNSKERTDKLIRVYFITTAICILVTLTIGSTSTGVFDAFTIIEDGISGLTENIDKKNAIVYKELDQTASDPALKLKVKKVKELSDEMYNYIFHLRSFLIVSVQGMPEKIADSLSLQNLDAKDNYDIPTHILIGGDPEKLLEGKFTARELKNKIAVFKMDLLQLINEKDRKSLDDRIGLYTNDEFDARSEEMVSWETRNFYHLPVSSVITILSHIQSNIRYAESEIGSALIKESNGAVSAEIIESSN